MRQARGENEAEALISQFGYHQSCCIRHKTTGLKRLSHHGLSMALNFKDQAAASSYVGKIEDGSQ